MNGEPSGGADVLVPDPKVICAKINIAWDADQKTQYNANGRCPFYGGVLSK